MTEPTLEMTRLRELRKASQDLIELMVADGWLEADSHGIALLEEGWLTLWREYTDRFEALEGADAKNDLFKHNKHNYYIGQRFPAGTKANLLKVGDCVEDYWTRRYKIVSDNGTSFTWQSSDLSFSNSPWNKNQIMDKEWKYIGRNLW